MKRTSRILVALIFCITTSIATVMAGDINNPAFSYKRLNTPEKDSLLIGWVIFDPLPSYETETSVIVNHVARFSTDVGLVIRADGRGVMSHRLSMSDRLVRVAGPIEIGDTIVAEFSITPSDIGIIPLHFIVYEDKLLSGPGRIRTGGTIKADFLLDPAGQTWALVSESVNSKNAGLLGPSWELLSRGTTFSVDVKPDFEFAGQDVLDHWEKTAAMRVFSTLVTVMPLPDEQSISILCEVTPYQSFEAGIGFAIQHSSELEVLEMGPSISEPVVQGTSYEFVSKVKLKEAGTAVLEIELCTPNPDIGTQDGVYSIRHKEDPLGQMVRLYLGLDDGGKVLFITGRRPSDALKVMKRQSGPAPALDSRLTHVQNHPVSKDRLLKRADNSYYKVVRYYVH